MVDDVCDRAGASRASGGEYIDVNASCDSVELPLDEFEAVDPAVDESRWWVVVSLEVVGFIVDSISV